MHWRVSCRLAQPLPPCAACWVIWRVRCCVPPPQVLLQLAHPAQLLTWQWIGHGCVLHTCEEDRLGHAIPP